MNQSSWSRTVPPSGAPLPSAHLVDEPQLRVRFRAVVDAHLREAALAWLEIAPAFEDGSGAARWRRRPVYSCASRSKRLR